MSEKFPLVGDESIMSPKNHGTSEKPVQKVRQTSIKHIGTFNHFYINDIIDGHKAGSTKRELRYSQI